MGKEITNRSTTTRIFIIIFMIPLIIFSSIYLANKLKPYYSTEKRCEYIPNFLLSYNEKEKCKELKKVIQKWKAN